MGHNVRLAGVLTPRQAGQSLGKPRAEGSSRVPGRLAATGVIAGLVIMVATGLLRQSWMPPRLQLPSSGFPVALPVHMSDRPIFLALWAGGILAAAGVITGLVAVRRGQPVPIKTIVVAAVVSVAVLVITPPAGSTDLLDYAIYGHILALGHSPYVMTPLQYRTLENLNKGVPENWLRDTSYYGPLATLEQLAAAKLAGSSLAATTFWLKLANALTFGAVALLAHRAWRGDRAGQIRAHLLWTANPLLIWSAIAAGHLDVLAAAIGVAGLLIIDRRLGRRPVLAALAAGLCLGAAIDIKVNYALFGLAAVLALWRTRARLLAVAAGAAGAAAVLVPSYVIAGVPALTANVTRAAVGRSYGLYRLPLQAAGLRIAYVVPIAIVLTIPLAWLALRRLPAGVQGQPAVRAALALSLAWLLLWPHQYAWYSVMFIVVLVFYPASRLDWIALTWLSVITISGMPGLGPGQQSVLGRVAADIQGANLGRIAPLTMFATAIALVILCVSGRWRAPAGQPPGAHPAAERAASGPSPTAAS